MIAIHTTGQSAKAAPLQDSHELSKGLQASGPMNVSP